MPPTSKRRAPSQTRGPLFMRQLLPWSEAGDLMAWAPDFAEQYRIAADYVDEILRGANPGDLPIRHPPRYFWTIHQTVAKAIGLTLSASVLAHVDRVIP